MVAKLFNENPNFKCEYKAPTKAYFDIETYDTEDADICPIASRSTSHMSMLSFICGDSAILFHLDKYSLNIQEVSDKLTVHCGKVFDI